MNNIIFSFHEFLHFIRQDKLGKFKFRFRDDPPQTERILEKLNEEYSVGLCDIPIGTTFKTASQLVEAEIFGGKSLRDRWGEIEVIECAALPFHEWAEVHLPSESRREIEHKFHRIVSAPIKEQLSFNEEALRQFPGDMDFLYRRICDEYFLATELQKEGKTEEAEVYYNRVIDHGKEMIMHYPHHYSATHFIARATRALGKPELIMDFCKHSPDDFRALVKKGRGEAVLWLREEKYKGFFSDIIRDAAMHDYRCDKQVEESRAEYVYSLIKELYDYEDVIEGICVERHKFNINDMGEDFSHIIGVLSRFSNDGHMMSGRIITEKYTELFTLLLNRREKPAQMLPDMEHENFALALLGAVNADILSVNDAVHDIGRIITENPFCDMHDFGYPMSVFEDGYPEFAELTKSDDAYILRALSEHEICKEANKKACLRHAENVKQFGDVNRAIEIIREGKLFENGNRRAIRAAIKHRKLEIGQLKELWDIAILTNDIDTKLFLYGLIEFPINIREMIAEAKRHDRVLLDPERTEKWDNECMLAYRLITVLGRTFCGEDDIRSYARELEEMGIPLKYRLGMQAQILAKDDTDAFFAYIDEIENDAEGSENLLHDIYFAVLTMWGMRNDIEPKPELLWRIYDQVMCSGCRTNAVRLMERYHCLPDRIREAAVYDCVHEIREIAEGYQG